MAPPSSRRPGQSRRAQYSLFVTYVIAIAGMFGGLALALSARFDPQGHAAAQAYLGDLTAPISGAGRSVVGGAGSLVDGVAAYVDAGSKNRALEAELRAARTSLIAARATERENYRLRRLVRLTERASAPVAVARLVASTGAASQRYATLTAGSNEGVESGQPVRTSEGLVGRVVAAGRSSARVLLIGDAGNVVPVKRIGDGMPALATGRGDGGLEVRALEAGANPFKRGDLFVTSGAGGVYPPGVPVALGLSSSREALVARPLADPNRMDFAMVERSYVALIPPEQAPQTALTGQAR